MLDILSCTGSLEFTRLALERLEMDLRTELELVEGVAGADNLILRGLINKMKI